MGGWPRKGALPTGVESSRPCRQPLDPALCSFPASLHPTGVCMPGMQPARAFPWPQHSGVLVRQLFALFKCHLLRGCLDFNPIRQATICLSLVASTATPLRTQDQLNALFSCLSPTRPLLGRCIADFDI